MPQYIAILDSKHLENSLFLKSFAQALSGHGNRKGIILHGDSAYTERIIQTGVMRDEAQIRATKDLNRRLIGLLADHGVSAIGLHAYQREMVTNVENRLELKLEEFNRLPDTPCLVISSLIKKEDNIKPLELSSLSMLFKEKIPDSEILLFSKKDKDEIIGFSQNQNYEWSSIPEEILKESTPDEFRNFRNKVILTTATSFKNWPNLEKVIKIG